MIYKINGFDMSILFDMSMTIKTYNPDNPVNPVKDNKEQK